MEAVSIIIIPSPIAADLSDALHTTQSVRLLPLSYIVSPMLVQKDLLLLRKCDLEARHITSSLLEGPGSGGVL